MLRLICITVPHSSEPEPADKREIFTAIKRGEDTRTHETVTYSIVPKVSGHLHLETSPIHLNLWARSGDEIKKHISVHHFHQVTRSCWKTCVSERETGSHRQTAEAGLLSMKQLLRATKTSWSSRSKVYFWFIYTNPAQLHSNLKTHKWPSDDKR